MFCQQDGKIRYESTKKVELYRSRSMNQLEDNKSAMKSTGLHLLKITPSRATFRTGNRKKIKERRKVVRRVASACSKLRIHGAYFEGELKWNRITEGVISSYS